MDVTVLVTALTSSGFMSLLLYFIQRYDRKKEKEKENETHQSQMLLALGHDKLVYLTDQYVRRGGITLKELRNLDLLYKPYEGMGGNGDCKIGYNACKELEVISEDRALALDAETKRKDYNL